MPERGRPTDYRPGVLYPEGHVFKGSGGQGYVATRDLRMGDQMRASDFRAFGGAPDPVEGKRMPQFLRRLLFN